jgi:hypothetical protein
MSLKNTLFKYTKRKFQCIIFHSKYFTTILTRYSKSSGEIRLLFGVFYSKQSAVYLATVEQIGCVCSFMETVWFSTVCCCFFPVILVDVFIMFQRITKLGVMSESRHAAPINLQGVKIKLLHPFFKAYDILSTKWLLFFKMCTEIWTMMLNIAFFQWNPRLFVYINCND